MPDAPRVDVVVARRKLLLQEERERNSKPERASIDAQDCGSQAAAVGVGEAGAGVGVSRSGAELLGKGVEGGPGGEGRFVEPVGGVALEMRELARRKSKVEERVREVAFEKQFENVMGALQGRGAGVWADAGERQEGGDEGGGGIGPAERLLQVCGEREGFTVRIEGLHDDVDNDMLFTFFQSINMPATDIDVPFDALTGLVNDMHSFS
jgi:hypothetical protein